MVRTTGAKSYHLDVSNVGGIDSTSVEFDPGVTVLTGRNATNRTSLLQALRAALGSRKASLKGDAESGHVELSIGDETYTRQLERTANGVSFGGEPYLDDPEKADLFAFLLEDNDARRAVVQERNLREIIMQPVNTEAIQDEIDAAVEEKRSISRRIEDLEALEAKLPNLEERKRTLESKIDETTEEIEAQQAKIDRIDADVEETRANKERREDVLDDLQETQTELESVRNRIESERESISALEDERSTVTEELDAFEEPDADVDYIEQELSRIREQKRTLESRINQLQQIVQFNDEMLSEEAELSSSLESLTEEEETGVITDQLVADTNTVCWTCGSSVSRESIEETLDRLKSLHREMVTDRSELSEQISELESKRKRVVEKRQQRSNYEAQLEELANEIKQREETLSNLQERRDELEADVEALETKLDELETEQQDTILERQRRLSELQFEKSSRQDELESVVDEIEEIEAQVAEKGDLQSRYDDLNETLAELRTRIETLEKEAVEAFNEQMSTVLDVLEYENIERIWIERTEQTVRRGRRKERETVFDLHIVRQAADGTAYEDTIHNLSESERKVTGLVFALAGYLVHDLHDELPFVLLDSLEALDSDRIAALVDHFSDYADYVVVALLPEDSAALPDACRRITDI